MYSAKDDDKNKHIYVIKGIDNTYKIGVSFKPESIFKIIKTSLYFDIELVKVFKNIGYAIIEIYDALSKYEINNNWYNCSIETIINKINSIETRIQYDRRILKERKLEEIEYNNRKRDLYIMECNGNYKIGRSYNPEKRLIEIQCSNPYTVKIVKIYKQLGILENILHKKLKEYRLNGEWFNCTYNRIDKEVLKEMVRQG